MERTKIPRIIHKLYLRGKLPSKKNLYRRKSGGGMYITEEVKAVLDSFQLQIQAQWPWHKEPLERAEVHARFMITKQNYDLDNIYTALQDLLVSARVLKGDNIKRLPRFSAEAVVAEEEAVEVTVVDLSDQ
jgi:Holliday junction resolvase RusA-like endonuclease